MAKRKRPVTWLEVGIHYAGMRTAVKATNWAYCWAVAREALDHEPSVEEVAQWWNMNDRTAYREQVAFRKAFPMLDTPAKIYESEEARAALARHADFADKVDQWKKERKLRRELDGIKAVMLASPENI